MSARNLLTQTPPHAVEASLERLGRDLRVARLRRNLTMAQVAERIGAGVRAVADAEQGKATTAVAVYLALLWAYGLLGDVALLAAPERDAEGEARFTWSAANSWRGAVGQLVYGGRYLALQNTV